MIAVNEIKTYEDGAMIWADATEVVEVSADAAWASLDPLLMRIIEIPSAGGESVKIRRARKDAPLTSQGNRLVAKAARLGGVLEASMSMEVTESTPPSYLRLAVHTYNMHFADIDFRITKVNSGCELTFRQGFRTSRKSTKAAGVREALTSREMPETARIFNLWVEIARSM